MGLLDTGFAGDGEDSSSAEVSVLAKSSEKSWLTPHAAGFCPGRKISQSLGCDGQMRAEGLIPELASRDLRCQASKPAVLQLPLVTCRTLYKELLPRRPESCV